MPAQVAGIYTTMRERKRKRCGKYSLHNTEIASQKYENNSGKCDKDQVTVKVNIQQRKANRQTGKQFKTQYPSLNRNTEFGANRGTIDANTSQFNLQCNSGLLYHRHCGSRFSQAEESIKNACGQDSDTN